MYRFLRLADNGYFFKLFIHAYVNVLMNTCTHKFLNCPYTCISLNMHTCMHIYIYTEPARLGIRDGRGAAGAGGRLG